METGNSLALLSVTCDSTRRLKYPVFWIHTGTAERMRQDDHDIVEKLGLRDLNDAGLVLRMMEEWFESERSGDWLIVYDSADDIEFPCAKEYGRLRELFSHDLNVALS